VVAMVFKAIVVSMVVHYYYLSSIFVPLFFDSTDRKNGGKNAVMGEFVSVPRIRFSVPHIRLLVIERLMSTSKKIR
jgi:hypothetical protein